jgi:poly(3-hydroxyalkanoate) synthetase
LAIWASYPAGNSDLSRFEIPVYLIYGELDPAANRESVLERAALLPADTVYLEIEGGDHHQFGTYLIDPEDDLALIPREEQQKQIIQGTLDMLGLVIQ